MDCTVSHDEFASEREEFKNSQVDMSNLITA
jgi:hypothetical protein